jgi:hypothetical protein
MYELKLLPKREAFLILMVHLNVFSTYSAQRSAEFEELISPHLAPNPASKLEVAEIT